MNYKTIENNKPGIYNNFYATTQLFLQASNTLQFDILHRIIIHVDLNPDIRNKDAYILTIIANETKKLQRNQKQLTV